MKFEIKQSEIDKTLKADYYVTPGDIDIMVGALEGMHAHIKEKGWVEGYRNDIAVDFTICCYLLGLDGKEIFGEFANEYRGVLYVDTLDFGERYDTVMKYCKYRWNDPWIYELDCSGWAREGEKVKEEDRIFTIVDDSEEAVEE